MGNSPVAGEFPTQRPVTRSFDVYFDLRPNKRLSKQSWGWWFGTPSYPLWRHHNEIDSTGQQLALLTTAANYLGLDIETININNISLYICIYTCIHLHVYGNISIKFVLFYYILITWPIVGFDPLTRCDAHKGQLNLSHQLKLCCHFHVRVTWLF